MRQLLIIIPIVLIFLFTLVVTSARSFLPGGLSEPAPIGVLLTPTISDTPNSVTHLAIGSTIESATNCIMPTLDIA